MLISRVASVYVLAPLLWRSRHRLSLKWQHILFWGGLRGSLSIALALSLPLTLAYRSELIMMIFGTVVFSLLVQGLTIAPLIRWLKFDGKPPVMLEYEVLQGRLLADTAAIAELDNLRNRGAVTPSVYEDLKADYSGRHQALGDQLTRLSRVERAVERQQEERIRRHLVNVKKTRLSELLHEGIISDATHVEVNRLLDEELIREPESPSVEG
jgi:CPA1 family monovalent cation:H+ antiporter